MFPSENQNCVNFNLFVIVFSLLHKINLADLIIDIVINRNSTYQFLIHSRLEYFEI